MDEGVARLAKSYAAFAETEAKGRSPLYVDICNGIAADTVLLDRLAAMPAEKQQPTSCWPQSSIRHRA